eukprot:GGOE01030412.1.p1 GENE.GGOE01030412.1~~GGOE01030412.1.p1  ORF type:complete len:852 (-),score=212.66 GGOE01030412.1:214-2706(-)
MGALRCCPSRISTWNWRLGPHNRSFLGFYRFVDPKMELQYCQQQATFWQAILRIYCVITFLFAAEELFSKVDNNGEPVFWVLLAISLSASGLLVLSLCWRGFAQWALPIHALYVCVISGAYAYQVRLDADGLAEENLQYIFGPTTIQGVDAIVGRAQERIDMLVNTRSVRDALLYSIIQWVSLALAGFNRWTVLTYSGIIAATVTGFCFLSSSLEIQLTSAFYVAVCTLAFSSVSVVMERIRRSDFLAHTQLSHELQATQLADSVLNHTLKNTLADVAGNIEMFLAGALDSNALGECILSLRRGMRSCKERLVYLKLAAGQYQPVLNAIHLQEFGRQLLAGRNATGRFPDCAIYADYMLLSLILDNALSNAAKHGAPQNPNVEFLVEELPKDPVSDDCQLRRFCFRVTNKANPSRAPLTPQYVQQLFAGTVQVKDDGVVPILSDRIGLTHCILAAKVGGIALSLTQEGDNVTFRVVLDAGVAPDTVQRAYSEVLPEPSGFPAGLRFVVLEDSLTAQRLLKFHIERWCQPSSVACFGATVEELEPFVAHAFKADIVIVDQHLKWDRLHLGTDIVRRLRLLPFQGFVCIRSADDGPDDRERYRLAGAHCSVGKDLLGQAMLQQLKEAYQEFVHNKSRVPVPTTQPIHTAVQMLSACAPPDTRLAVSRLSPPFNPLDTRSSSWTSQVDTVPGCVPPFMGSQHTVTQTLPPPPHRNVVALSPSRPPCRCPDLFILLGPLTLQRLLRAYRLPTQWPIMARKKITTLSALLVTATVFPPLVAGMTGIKVHRCLAFPDCSFGDHCALRTCEPALPSAALRPTSCGPVPPIRPPTSPT